MGESKPDVHVKGLSGLSFTALTSSKYFATFADISLSIMSKQNYTIFINQCSITLVPVAQKINLNIPLAQFKNYVHQCLTKDNQYEAHYKLNISSPSKFIQLLIKEFKFIQAAGGIVEEDGQYLYIKRFDRWDLPKGKLEKGETIRNAAIREVEEECGVRNLRIIKELPCSYHIYLFQNQPALKETFWFLMQSTEKITNLLPQTEEGITDVQFADKDFLLQPDTRTYSSLKQLFM